MGHPVQLSLARASPVVRRAYPYRPRRVCRQLESQCGGGVVKAWVWVLVVIAAIIGLGNSAITGLGMWTVYVAGGIGVTSALWAVFTDEGVPAPSDPRVLEANGIVDDSPAAPSDREMFTAHPPSETVATTNGNEGRVLGSVMFALLVGTAALCALGVVGLFFGTPPGADDMTPEETLCLLLEDEGVDCVP